ncbi:hypothetical protein PanWU01x14_361940, partial [Parasponia andersonii]
GMMNLMVESRIRLVNTWTSQQIEIEGGVADIQVDDFMIGFSKELISRACFGSNYSKGGEIFLNLRGLEENMTKRTIFNGIPISRFEASDLDQDHDVDQIAVDNFKTIYLAEYETAAVSTAWTLPRIQNGKPEFESRS